MQLHQLEYLVAVADEGGFSAAAQRLRVSQPGVSAQVRKLERELGHALFDRGGHPVRPTAVGAEVLGPARAALAAAADVRHTVDALTGLLRGQVRAGTITGSAGLPVAETVADFVEAHPGVEVALTEDRPGELPEAVRCGRLDLALLATTGPLPAGLTGRTVREEPLVVAVPPDDPFADHGSIPLAALAEQPVVAPPPAGALRAALDALLEGAGRGPARVRLEATDPATLARLVLRGRGRALLPASLEPLRTGRLPGLLVDGAPVPSALTLAWRADGVRSPAAVALTEALLAALPGRGPDDGRAVGPFECGV